MTDAQSGIDLYWLPLGAGDAHPSVRWSGPDPFEALVARHEHREPRRPLPLCAGGARPDGSVFVIEMAPVWAEATGPDRGVVCEGAVGLSRPRPAMLRFVTRRTAGATASSRTGREAVASPMRLSDEDTNARVGCSSSCR